MVVEKRQLSTSQDRLYIESSQTHYTYNSTTEHLPTAALPARNEMVAILMNFIVDGMNQGRRMFALKCIRFYGG